MMLRSLSALLVLAGLVTAPTLAAEVNIAVAANFTRPAEALGRLFAKSTGHKVLFSFGATGGLYAQITQGAPFEVLLAADDVRPTQAVDEGYGVPGSVFTYAIGTPVLYSPTIEVTDGASVLAEGGFRHLAVADPLTAPYGAAAMEILAALGLADKLAPRLVTGSSITQTLQFVESGNAELGFVALSQVIDAPPGQTWMPPEGSHAPIQQDAVLLMPGADRPAAMEFLEFLRSKEAALVMTQYGYVTGFAP